MFTFYGQHLLLNYWLISTEEKILLNLSAVSCLRHLMSSIHSMKGRLKYANKILYYLILKDRLFNLLRREFHVSSKVFFCSTPGEQNDCDITSWEKLRHSLAETSVTSQTLSAAVCCRSVLLEKQVIAKKLEVLIFIVHYHYSFSTTSINLF